MLDDDFLVLVNSWWEPLGFVLPPTRPGAMLGPKGIPSAIAASLTLFRMHMHRPE
jgi:hypothetical protein